MADSPVDFEEETKESIELKSDFSEISDFPQTLVTEKIIFVIDVELLVVEKDKKTGIEIVMDLCKAYLHLKKKTCIKPPEFECLLYKNDEFIHSHINVVKDLQAVLLKIKDLDCDEEKPLILDKVFDEIAKLVELPDPDCSKNSLPPNWVYHAIWLFGQNVHVPILGNPNSFNYLMMTPYFALDVLYLYDESEINSQCDKISQALVSLNGNGKGYFFEAKINEEQLFSGFAQFLGNPLMRVPQLYSQFKVLQLGHNLGHKTEIYSDKEN